MDKFKSYLCVTFLNFQTSSRSNCLVNMITLQELCCCFEEKDCSRFKKNRNKRKYVSTSASRLHKNQCQTSSSECLNNVTVNNEWEDISVNTVLGGGCESVYEHEENEITWVEQCCQYMETYNFKHLFRLICRESRLGGDHPAHKGSLSDFRVR